MLPLEFKFLNIGDLCSKLYLYVSFLIRHLLFYFKGIFFTLSLIRWFKFIFPIMSEIFVENLDYIILLFKCYSLRLFSNKLFIKPVGTFNYYLCLLNSIYYFYSNTTYIINIKQLFIITWLLIKVSC